MNCDVLIVGGGAAGLSAALVLSRARRSVVVVDAGHPRNAPASHMQGFLGSDGLPPSDLLAAGRREATGYGAEMVDATVTGIRRADTDGGAAFTAVLDHGGPLTARRLLVTTGLVDRMPGIPGLQDRWGIDVLHCPYCHGYEVRDQPVGVLGGSSEAIAHAQLIRQWSDDVIFFSLGSEPGGVAREGLEARGIGLVEEPIERIVVTDNRLRGVRLANGETVARSALFVRPRFVPNSALLTELGCTTDASGWVEVDASGRTGVPGVWAAGNAVNPRAQVITAAGEGSTAAIAINNDLVEDEVAAALRRRRRRPGSRGTAGV